MGGENAQDEWLLQVFSWERGLAAEKQPGMARSSLGTKSRQSPFFQRLKIKYRINHNRKRTVSSMIIISSLFINEGLFQSPLFCLLITRPAHVASPL